MWNMISFIFGIISFAIPKLAVAALLHRILNPSLIQRIIVWGLVILVAIIALINILIYVTMCNPPQALWKPSMILKGEATCRNVWILIDYATFNGGERCSISWFSWHWLIKAKYEQLSPHSSIFSSQSIPVSFFSNYKCHCAKRLHWQLRLVWVQCMQIWKSIPSIAPKLTCAPYASAAATAMVKCAQLKGLADQTDPTC